MLFEGGGDEAHEFRVVPEGDVGGAEIARRRVSSPPPLECKLPCGESLYVKQAATRGMNAEVQQRLVEIADQLSGVLWMI